MQKYTVGIYTLGCKVSQYESQAIAEEFERAGFAVLPFESFCDVYVVNTCTVTAESDRKCRQFIRRARTKSERAILMVTGCYSQVSPAAVSKIDGVDYIGGSYNKLGLVKAARELLVNRRPPHPIIDVPKIEMMPFENMKITRAPRTRAYVKIEDGCESRCTYCKIPDARGKIRSKLSRDIIDEVKTLVEGGTKEVVLTGIETASFGRDTGENLADLLTELDKIDNLFRIRLGSLDPSVMRDEFVEKLSQIKKLAPHFHLSMQSGSDKILAAMKRKYNSAIALAHIENVRRRIPQAMFTTDMMVGFPDESDEDFSETLEFCRKARFLNVHVFAYSKRAGTPAAAMKNQVPDEIKHERSAKLIALKNKIGASVISDAICAHPLTDVLFEQGEDGYEVGHTANFIEVRVKSPKPLHGEILPVQLTKSADFYALGRL